MNHQFYVLNVIWNKDIYAWWGLHSPSTWVFCGYSLSGRENKPIWTLLHPDVNASQRVSPVKQGTGWDIYELLTHVIQIFSQEFSPPWKPQQPFFFFCFILTSTSVYSPFFSLKKKHNSCLFWLFLLSGWRLRSVSTHPPCRSHTLTECSHRLW